MSIDDYTVYRNSCDDERLAKALGGPASFEASCLSVETRAISVYEPGALAPHAINTRVDLSRKELSKGKVP